MTKIIEVDKSISRKELDEKLSAISPTKTAIDLNKYFGKVKFAKSGLVYQLKTRSEWL